LNNITQYQNHNFWPEKEIETKIDERERERKSERHTQTETERMLLVKCWNEAYFANMIENNALGIIWICYK
jgi:hypothetical protein